MAIFKAAWLGEAGLTDVGYQFFTGTEAKSPRITADILDTGDGWYETNVVYPDDFSGYLYWNSLSNPDVESREYIIGSPEDELPILTIIANDAVTNRPIGNAVVRVSFEEIVYTSKTNSGGVAQLTLPLGNYVISIIKDGYAFITRNLGITEDVSSIFEVYPVSADAGRLKLAEQIWRDAQLPVDTFSFLTDEDVIQWLATSIVPETESYVDAKLNLAVMPYSYPLETTVIQLAYPNQTYTYVSQLKSSWADSRINVIKFLCLYRIFLMADTIKKEYLVKADAFKKAADQMLEVLVAAMQGIILSVTTGGRKFGFVHVKLPKYRRERSEFGW